MTVLPYRRKPTTEWKRSIGLVTPHPATIFTQQTEARAVQDAKTRGPVHGAQAIGAAPQHLPQDTGSSQSREQ